MKIKSLILKGSFLLTSLVFCSSIYMQSIPEVSKKDTKTRACLIEALAHEALNQPVKGQMAVLDVIQNRVQDKRFPDTICKVIHASKQFSYRNHLKVGVSKPVNLESHIDRIAVKRIENLVDFFLQGNYTPVLSNKVLWYTRTEVQTVWMKKLKTEVILGSHKFLKEVT